MMPGLLLTMCQEGESWPGVSPLAWAHTVEETKPRTLYAPLWPATWTSWRGPPACLVSAPISPFGPFLHQAQSSAQTRVLIFFFFLFFF